MKKKNEQRIWWFIKKSKIELPYDPLLLFLDIYPKELKAGSQMDTCTLRLIALFIVTKRWQQPIEVHQ